MIDCYGIIVIIMMILLLSIAMVYTERKSSNDYDKGMLGGVKKKKPSKYIEHESKLTNIHHNDDARYIFIYLADIYPKGLQEGVKFKSIINQTRFKNEAYAVYERPCNGQWVDNLMIDSAWDDFEQKYTSTFINEITNGARLVFIGKGFGSVYAKIFGAIAKKRGLSSCLAISLNGIHLREFIPALIMQKLGLQDININDIQFTQKQCLYKGKDYLKILGINNKLYLLLFICDSINDPEYYSFYGTDGSKYVEITPITIVYDNTFLVKYGNFKLIDWLKVPSLLDAAIKEVI